MTTIKINGKDYRLKARVGDVNRLVKKYREEIDGIRNKWKNDDVKLDGEKTAQFIVEMVWGFIRPRFIFKPFITFSRFNRMVELIDLNNAAGKAFLLLHGIKPEEWTAEDGDSGNVTLPSSNGLNQ